MLTGQSFPETRVFFFFLFLTAQFSLSLSHALSLSWSLSLSCVWVSVRRRKGEDERKEEGGEVSGENEVKSRFSCFNPSRVRTR
jgi:hypothetical protein